MTTTPTPAAKISVRSHHILVHSFNEDVRIVCLRFCMTMVQWGLERQGRRTVKKMLRTFAASNRPRSQFRFHRHQLEEFLTFAGNHGVYRDRFQIESTPLYEPERVDLPKLDPRELRDYQIPLDEYLVAPPPPEYAPSKVVYLQTGKGKTFLALTALHQLGLRTLLVIKGMYVERWVPDIKKYYGLKPGELLVVRGGDQLKSLMNMALDGSLKAKFIVITNRTLQMYIQNCEYEMVENGGYPIGVEEFYEKLKIGVRVIDEVHQDFHLNYKMDLYTHVPLTISLSATLDSDDRFINRLYGIVWPMVIRSPVVEHDCYIDVYSHFYSVLEPNKIRCTNAMRQYSHVMFEESIMKHPRMLESYLEMVQDMVGRFFMDDRAAGQKMLVFFATVAMCTFAQEYLQDAYPDIKVKRYTQEDPYEVLETSDIIVSTVQSAGTAVDIPNLRETLMTNALNSKQSNLQVLGRTRPLIDWPDVTPRFHFLAAREIQKHVDYAEEKKLKFIGKVKSFNVLSSPYRI